MIAARRPAANFGNEFHKPIGLAKATAISGKPINSSFLKKPTNALAKGVGRQTIWSVGITLCDNPVRGSLEKLYPFQNRMPCTKSLQGFLSFVTIYHLLLNHYQKVLYQQLKIKEACKSICKPFLFVPSIHYYVRDQTISRPLNVEIWFACLASAYIWSVAVTLKEFFATKAVADKPNESERKILICMPMAITKSCKERIRVKSLSLSLPSSAI